MNNNEFIEKIKSLGINPTDKQLADLETYYDMLIEWNNKINITKLLKNLFILFPHIIQYNFIK